jgi:hypothetical protein
VLTSLPDATLANGTLLPTTLLWLIGHEGLATDQAAFVAGVPPAVFRVRLHRARRALRRKLDDRVAESTGIRTQPAVEVIP